MNGIVQEFLDNRSESVFKSPAISDKVSRANAILTTMETNHTTIKMNTWKRCRESFVNLQFNFDKIFYR